MIGFLFQILLTIANAVSKSGSPKIYIEMLLIKYIKEYMCIKSTEKNISQEIISLGNNLKEEKNTLVEKEKSEPIADAFATEKEINVDEDDDEYDFDKEFSLDEEENEFSSDISEYNEISGDSESNYDGKVIINIDEIIKVRANNTLAKADKSILNNEIKKMELLNDYTFDQEIGYIVCNLLDSVVRAASENNVILSYEYDSVVKQNLIDLDKITYVYNKILGSDKKLAIITHDDWEKYKSDYIKCIKDGKQFEFIEEPVEIYEEDKKNDIIVNSAVELFGDIVEIN